MFVPFLVLFSCFLLYVFIKERGSVSGQEETDLALLPVPRCSSVFHAGVAVVLNCTSVSFRWVTTFRTETVTW